VRQEPAAVTRVLLDGQPSLPSAAGAAWRSPPSAVPARDRTHASERFGHADALVHRGFLFVGEYPVWIAAANEPAGGTAVEADQNLIPVRVVDPATNRGECGQDFDPVSPARSGRVQARHKRCLRRRFRAPSH
jgi:hypothetical protein